MFTIAQVVAALRVTRAEFSNLFLQVQVGLPSPQRTLFEAVATAGSDQEAFAQAVTFAEGQGWLESLVNVIIEEGLEDGSLARTVTENALLRHQGNAALQAITNVARGFTLPDIIYRGVANGMRWTGKIYVDGTARGTGVLVGPHLVLTAWHVVRPLFIQNPSGDWEADAAAGPRLEVVFDNFMSLVDRGTAFQPAKSFQVQAHKNWCVNFSRCHIDELADQLPGDGSLLEGFWDYAILRLAKAPGLERRWASLDARATVPRADEGIVLFQHPDGQSLKIDQHFIANAVPPRPGIIPQLRFLHYANTINGSSGGPCFDKSFMLFGLHQGVWSSNAVPGRVTNRGIPILRILDDIKEKIQELPAPDPVDAPLWNLGTQGNYSPVIGCDAFQSIVWRSATGGKAKLLVVTGEPGRGKTFRVSLLSVLLPDGGHLKINLSAESLSALDAIQLATLICATAGVDRPAFTPVIEVNSTTALWLRDEVMPKVIAALDSVRNGRLVWLIITDLNKSDIKDPQAAQLLLLLYEQLIQVDWLRILLDGYRGDIPVSLRQMTERNRVTEVSREDIEMYLQRVFADMELFVERLSVAATAATLMFDYDGWLDSDAATAMQRLASRISIVANHYLEASAQV